MPSGRMESGVTPSRRRISLKGAVAHFFLSFFLFLPHASTCFLSFLIEEPHFLSHTSLSPRAVHSLRAALVLSPLRADRSPPPLPCPRCAPSARRRPVLSSLRAVCSPPPLSCLLPEARKTLCRYSNLAESKEEREVAIVKGHFPKGPPGTYEPSAGGRAFEWVDVHLVGYLLAKAANTAALGDDRISADILKVFWQWD